MNYIKIQYGEDTGFSLEEEFNFDKAEQFWSNMNKFFKDTGIISSNQSIYISNNTSVTPSNNNQWSKH